MSADRIETAGIVEKVDRGDLHRVAVHHGPHVRTVLARRAGWLALQKIKIVAGDRVTVEINAYDPTRGRITRRL